MNNTENSKNTSNIFKRLHRKYISGKGRVPHTVLNEMSSEETFNRVRNETPYFSPAINTILFLSKRGISRAPLAREVMRSELHLSNHFGSIRPSARGISEAYDLCSFDKRMTYMAKHHGYEISGHSRRVNSSELSSATLIIPMDEESDKFTKSRTFYIRGKVLPISDFIIETGNQYVLDPFSSDDSMDSTEKYNEIILAVKLACKGLISSIPSLIE